LNEGGVTGFISTAQGDEGEAYGWCIEYIAKRDCSIVVVVRDLDLDCSPANGLERPVIGCRDRFWLDESEAVVLISLVILLGEFLIVCYDFSHGFHSPLGG